MEFFYNSEECCLNFGEFKQIILMKYKVRNNIGIFRDRVISIL